MLKIVYIAEFLKKSHNLADQNLMHIFAYVFSPLTLFIGPTLSFEQYRIFLRESASNRARSLKLPRVKIFKLLINPLLMMLVVFKIDSNYQFRALMLEKHDE